MSAMHIVGVRQVKIHVGNPAESLIFVHMIHGMRAALEQVAGIDCADNPTVLRRGPFCAPKPSLLRLGNLRRRT